MSLPTGSPSSLVTAAEAIEGWKQNYATELESKNYWHKGCILYKTAWEEAETELNPQFERPPMLPKSSAAKEEVKRAFDEACRRSARLRSVSQRLNFSF